MNHQSSSTNKKLVAMWPYGLAAALVSSGLTAPVALAQESAGLEEIIVTATKREVNLQDVSQSIMALSNEDIEKMGIKSMADYIKALPSVVLTAEVPGRNDLVMRGNNTGCVHLVC